jgi:hypothetical protein
MRHKTLGAVIIVTFWLNKRQQLFYNVKQQNSSPLCLHKIVDFVVFSLAIVSKQLLEPV